MATPVGVRKQSLILRSELLSYGTYAKVYWDRFASNQVVKVLNSSACKQAVLRDIGFGTWFTQEGEAMDYVVRHREIVRDGRSEAWGIVMDYGGPDLQVLLTNRKHKTDPVVSPSDYLRVTRQALTALYRLHEEAGMMHRDLKPANMFWNGKTKKLVIGDFNLSLFIFRSMFEKDGKDIRDMKGSLDSVVQTRWYRAPEVILGDQQYTPKIDVWSLGLILLYLWSGYVPRGGCAVEQLWLAFALGGTAPPRSYLTRLARWKPLTGMGVLHTTGDQDNPTGDQDNSTARAIPLILPKHKENGLWTTSLLEKHLKTIPYPELRQIVRGMLQVDPTHRLSMQDIVRGDAFRALFPSFDVHAPRATEWPVTMDLPIVPDGLRSALHAALDWGVHMQKHLRKFVYLSHGVWFGYARAVYHVVAGGQGTRIDWVRDKTYLAAMHYIFRGLIDDLVELVDYEELSGICYARLPQKVTQVLEGCPYLLSLYLNGPWCRALRQAVCCNNEDKAAALLRNHMQKEGLTSLTFTKLLHALNGA